MIYLTVWTGFWSLIVLFMSAQDDRMTLVPLYIGQYSLFNTYVFLAAFFFAPSFEKEGNDGPAHGSRF